MIFLIPNHHSVPNRFLSRQIFSGAHPIPSQSSIFNPSSLSSFKSYPTRKHLYQYNIHQPRHHYTNHNFKPSPKTTKDQFQFSQNTKKSPDDPYHFFPPSDSDPSSTPPPPIDPRVALYNRRILESITNHRYQEIQLIFTEMLKSSVTPNEDTFSYLFQYYVKVGEPSSIQALVEMMESINMKRTIPIINSLIYFYTEKGQFHDACYEWCLMGTSHLVPASKTIELYAKAHSKAGYYEKALSLFDQLCDQYSIVQDAEMHSTMIEIMLDSGRTDLALHRFEAMKSGQLPRPTNTTFAIMMKWYQEKEEWQQVQGLFESIESMGLYPTEENYQPLVVGYCAQGLEAQLMTVFEEMARKKLPPTKITLDQGLRFFSNLEKMSSMERIMMLAIKAGTIPNRETINQFIKMMTGKANCPDRALAYMEKFRKEYGFKPESDLYVYFLIAYGNEAKLEKVIKLYRTMAVLERIKPTPSTFFAMIHAYAKCGKPLAIATMLEKPSVYGIPDINWYLFSPIIALLKKKDVKAMDLLFQFDWTQLKQLPGLENELMSINEFLAQFRHNSS